MNKITEASRALNDNLNLLNEAKILELEARLWDYKTIMFNQEKKIEQLKSILRDAYLEGYENGWERKEGGVSSFGINEDLANKYINRL
jgi:hypothetical protein